MTESLRPRFLTAEWRHLAMLNYEIDPGLLAPFIPNGTELDTWENKAYLSMVGFHFMNIRVLGLPIPFHRSFEEVNLRFYVRHKSGEQWRRGVVFIKELVPRRAVAFVARALYNENYLAVPMAHDLTTRQERDQTVRLVSYSWVLGGRQNKISVISEGESVAIEEGTQEEFIADHAWGYSSQRDGDTVEYHVEHPRWRFWTAKEASLDCDVSSLCGNAFAPYLEAPPASAFLADGSNVTVRLGSRVKASHET